MRVLQACFKNFSIFNCLTFCFPEGYIFRRQKKTAVRDGCPYFRLLNATRKMMTCLRHNQIKF